APGSVVPESSGGTRNRTERARASNRFDVSGHVSRLSARRVPSRSGLGAGGSMYASMGNVMKSTRNGWKNGWSHRLLATCLGLMLLILPAGLMSAWAPEPDPVPTRWELNFDAGPLRVIRLDTPSGPRHYFYMTYRVINHS